MRKSLREFADVHYGKSPNGVLLEDGSIPVVGTGGVYAKATRPLFHGPAIVVPRKGSLGNPQYMSGPFWAVDTTYAVLPKRGIHARWLHYNLDLFDLTKLNEATGVPSISRDWLYKIQFEDPGEVAQPRIAEILSAVDEVIEQTEVLIAKTQQIKAGLMHDLFTRGVTADGQLRPPREEAPQLYKESPLGWIPKEWETPRLGYIVDLDVGFAFKSSWFQSEGVNLLRGENVGYGKPDWTDRQCFDPSRVAEFAAYTLQPGDVVIGMDRTFTKSGVKVTILGADDCPALLVQRVGRFRALRCEHSYMHRVLETPAYLRALAVQQKGMDIPHLSKSEILYPRVPLPPQGEQRFIAERLDVLQWSIHCEEDELRKFQLVRLGMMNDLLKGRVSVTIACLPDPKKVAASV